MSTFSRLMCSAPGSWSQRRRSSSSYSGHRFAAYVSNRSYLDCSSGWLEGPNKVYIPFLACGDLTGYDSDRFYPLPKEADGSSYQSLDPVQSPIVPPFQHKASETHEEDKILGQKRR